MPTTTREPRRFKIRSTHPDAGHQIDGTYTEVSPGRIELADGTRLLWVHFLQRPSRYYFRELVDDYARQIQLDAMLFGSAWRAGDTAARIGKPASACPFDPTDEGRMNAWLSGHVTATDEIAKASAAEIAALRVVPFHSHHNN